MLCFNTGCKFFFSNSLQNDDVCINFRTHTLIIHSHQGFHAYMKILRPVCLFHRFTQFLCEKKPQRQQKLFALSYR